MDANEGKEMKRLKERNTSYDENLINWHLSVVGTDGDDGCGHPRLRGCKVDKQA